MNIDESGLKQHPGEAFGATWPGDPPDQTAKAHRTVSDDQILETPLQDPTYIYQPLQKTQGEQEVRLITLMPSTRNGDIYCEIKQAQLVLSNHPAYVSYEALSYVWGDPKREGLTLVLNEARVSVTENLWQALFHLRRKDTPRVLWVDALCIDQKNIEERGHQVSLMPSIYNNASNVIGWLGPGDDFSTRRAIQFLLNLRQKSILQDSMIPELIQNGWSDRRITQFLNQRYVTTSSDDNREISRGVESIRSSNSVEFGPQPGEDTYQVELHDKSSTLDPNLQREMYDEWIIQGITHQWPDSRLLEFLLNRYLTRRELFPTYDLEQDTLIQTERFTQRINKMRKWVQMSVDERVESKLKEHPLFLPTTRTVLDSLTSQDKWADIGKLCSLEYWNRLWIVQEVVLPRQVYFRLGRRNVSWRTLSGMFLCLKYTCDDRYKGPDFLPRLLHSPAARLMNLRRDYHAQSSMVGGMKGFGLINILVTCRKSCCSDPRDKVYGLLGLAKNIGLDIYPDYRRSIPQLYQVVMSRLGLWRDDQLIWFSAFIQDHLGGIPRYPRISPEHPGHIYRTRGRSNGKIFVLGDLFTTLADSKVQIQKWQSLYYHRILSHEPVENLSVAVQSALQRLGHDFERVIGINSPYFHAREIIPSKISVTWDPVRSQFSDLSMGDSSEECEFCSKFLKQQETDDRLPDKEEIQNMTASFRSIQLGSNRQPRWMMGSHGQIGLVSQNSEEGDMICHFRDTDVAVIIRRQDPYSTLYTLVVSALILRRWDEEEIKVYDDSEEIFQYSVGPRYNGMGSIKQDADVVEFHLDLETLRLLTSQPNK